MKSQGYTVAPRVFHSSVYHDNVVFTFGGSDPSAIDTDRHERMIFNDLVIQHLWVCYLDYLPADVLLSILMLLDHKSLQAMSCTCKALNKITEDERCE